MRGLSGGLRTESPSSGALCHPSPAGQWLQPPVPTLLQELPQARLREAAPKEPSRARLERQAGLLLFHETQPSILRVFLGKGQAETRGFAIQNMQGK